MCFIGLIGWGSPLNFAESVGGKPSDSKAQMDRGFVYGKPRKTTLNYIHIYRFVTLSLAGSWRLVWSNDRSLFSKAERI